MARNLVTTQAFRNNLRLNYTYNCFPSSSLRLSFQYFDSHQIRRPQRRFWNQLLPRNMSVASSTCQKNEKGEEKRTLIISDRGTENKTISKPKSTKEKSEIIKRIIDTARPEWSLILCAATTLGITSSVTLIYPQASAKIIDLAIFSQSGGEAVCGADAFYEALKLTTGLFGLTVLAGVGVYIRSVLLNKAGNRIVARVRKKFYSSVLAQENAFFDEMKTGDLISRLSSDSVLIQKSVTADAVGALRGVIMSLGSTFLLFYSSPKLAVVSLCSIPPVFFAARVFGKRLKEEQKKIQQRQADATSIAEEIFQGIKTVKQFASEEYEIKRYNEVLTDAHQKAIESASLQAAFDGSVHIAANAAILLVLGFGGKMVFDGEISGGDLAGFLMYSLFMAGNVSSLSSIYTEMSKALAASERVFQIIDRQPQIPPTFQLLDDAGSISIAKQVEHDKQIIAPSIEFKNVDFSFPSRPDVLILSGLTFKIEAGENVAIVGISGSGKSTITSLLTRLYDISTSKDGSITLNNEDIRSMETKSLRDKIGIVSQEPLLFAGSIAENIRYGRRSATNAEVEEAAQKANVMEFCKQLPKELDTEVGQRGTKISGGQKQRIAIARAILKDPPIVILDEATSALDAESEHSVQQALKQFTQDRTVLSIAHRLSTIRESDRILVLKNGNVIESGKYEDLIQNQNGAFVDLMGKQLLA